MKVHSACVGAFGAQANNMDFIRKVRDLLRLEGIDASLAEARRLRYNCIEVCGGNPAKTVHIGMPRGSLQVTRREPSPTVSAKVIPIRQGAWAD